MHLKTFTKIAYIKQMRHSFYPALVLGVLAQPALAEEDGPSLMERGAQLFIEGFMREMEPALKDLQGMAEDMEPALRQFMTEIGPGFVELLGQIEDLSAYHAPEILPNGDIIIRKKTPAEQAAEDDEGDIEI